MLASHVIIYYMLRTDFDQWDSELCSHIIRYKTQILDNTITLEHKI